MSEIDPKKVPKRLQNDENEDIECKIVSITLYTSTRYLQALFGSGLPPQVVLESENRAKLAPTSSQKLYLVEKAGFAF